uniref:Uncharacterized protein n=1 Tax=Aplanochytrium stocchinoi TaxID=215587 RepID=A0A7S3PJ94_9STRA
MKMISPGIRDGLFGTVQKHDPPNSLKMKGSLKAKPNKLLAIADQIPLDKVKEIKVKFEGATINDILLAIMTMSVRSYLEEIEDPIVKKKTMFGRKASPIRGNFPVSLRDTKKPILRNKNPTNYWTPLSFRFPFDWETGADCVWKVKTQIDEVVFTTK